MTADNFYWYASVLIFLPWLLLLFAPNWRFTERIAFAAGFILLLAAAVFTIRYLLSETSDGGSLLSLRGLENLFRSKEMLLTGWLNYLSFSLFAGTWMSHDAREQDIPHIWMLLPLLLTMVLGPTGLLFFLVIRFFKTRKWEVK